MILTKKARKNSVSSLPSLSTMRQIACPNCSSGTLVGSVTFTNEGSEVPILHCETCEFHCEMEDFNPNASYCSSCAEKGMLAEMQYDVLHNDCLTCEICGQEEEIEKESASLTARL